MHENKITIFTDGASRGNPGPGGWGAVVVSGDEVAELGGSELSTTNNRMELQAVIGALAHISQTGAVTAATFPIKIYTDSSYVLNGATKWIFGWAEKGWRTAAKKEVLNQDLWQQLAPLLNGKKISWQLVSGHVGVKGNERCDKIATAFADNKQPKLFSGALAEYRSTIMSGADILDISHDTTAKERRSGSKSRSNTKAFSYVSKVGGRVMTHKTWAECEARVKGVRGALFKKAISPEEEVRLMAEFEKA